MHTTVHRLYGPLDVDRWMLKREAKVLSHGLIPIIIQKPWKGRSPFLVQSHLPLLMLFIIKGSMISHEKNLLYLSTSQTILFMSKSYRNGDSLKFDGFLFLLTQIVFHNESTSFPIRFTNFLFIFFLSLIQAIMIISRFLLSFTLLALSLLVVARLLDAWTMNVY